MAAGFWPKALEAGAVGAVIGVKRRAAQPPQPGRSMPGAGRGQLAPLARTLAAAFWQNPSQKLAFDRFVTGTNGKTTTTH